jgi:hypothetical protein
VAEGSRDLDQLVHITTFIYCNKDFKKKKGPAKGKEKG